MNRIASSLLATTLASSLAACASTDFAVAARPSTTTAFDSASTESLSRSAAVRAAVDAVACAIGSAEAPRCDAVAHAAGVDVGALRAGSHVAAEGVSELLTSVAQREGMNAVTRAALVEWFDRAMYAAREAGVARAGAHCRALTACGQRSNPSLDQIEEAQRLDASGVRAQRSLLSLFAMRLEGSPFVADIEATALLVLAHRIETAATARPEVREDALAAVVALTRELHLVRTAATNAPATATARAHERDLNPSTVIADARSQLAAALTEVASRVTPEALRTTVNAAAARLREPRR